MSDLPQGWEWARLNEIAEVRLGRQRSPKNHSGTHMRPYLRAANVGWDGLKLHDVKLMNFTDAEFATYKLEPGDVVISEASGSAGEVGKPALWKGEIEDCCFQNTLIRVRSYGVKPSYLVHYLRAEALCGAFVEKARGVGIHHLGAAKLADWPVPIPPLGEQRRIVDTLEGHLSRVGVGAMDLRKVELKLAILERRILSDVIANIDSTSHRRVSINEIAKVTSGLTPLKSRTDYYDGGDIPWITSSQLNSRYVTKAERFVTKKAVDETSLKLLPAGTILVAMYGEGRTRGKCSELMFPATTNQACAAVVLDKDYEDYRPWVKLFFEANYESNRRLSAGGVQPNLNLGLIKSMTLSLPPVDELATLLTQLDERRNILNKLMADGAKASQMADQLRRSLHADAFAGRLVAQDPHDEPASVLLERIQAERTPRQQPKRTRGVPRT